MKFKIPHQSKITVATTPVSINRCRIICIPNTKVTILVLLHVREVGDIIKRFPVLHTLHQVWVRQPRNS